MPLVSTIQGDPNQAVLGQGVGDLGEGLGAYFMKSRMEKRLNDDRTYVEQQIREAPDYQGALTAIDNAPFAVKNTFGDKLNELAKARFPETELTNVMDSEGGLHTISHPKGQPLSDEEIQKRGYQPAKQYIIVSTDPKGKIEIHDSAIGEGAASEDLQRYQEMFPNRTFQVAQGPETETFFKIRDQQLRQMEIEKDRKKNEHVPSVEEMKFFANVRAEMEDDPLVTENGAMALQGNKEAIANRFKDFNTKFDGKVFSLDNPESAANVQNGVATASKAMARGLPLEKATDLGFNVQIASNVVSNLLKGGELDNGVIKETQARFNTNPGTLNEAISKVHGSPAFQKLEEFSPKNPATLPVKVNNGDGTSTVIRFVKINGRVVPYSSEKQ